MDLNSAVPGKKPAPEDAPAPSIYPVRGQSVMLDTGLAALYGVSTKVFNQAIRRNARRFPAGFRFQLTADEFENLQEQPGTPGTTAAPALRSQFVTLKTGGRGRHRKYLPWAFTEHGAIMAATILRSPRAVAMSLYVVRAFVRMREELMTNAVILKRLAQMDRRLLEHDVALREVVERLLPLLDAPPEAPPKRSIGFHEGNR